MNILQFGGQGDFDAFCKFCGHELLLNGPMPKAPGWKAGECELKPTLAMRARWGMLCQSLSLSPTHLKGEKVGLDMFTS